MARSCVAKFLREEGSERLVFPGLQVTRRPVVEQGDAEQVLRRFGDRHAFAECIALAHDEAEFQFEVEPL